MPFDADTPVDGFARWVYRESSGDIVLVMAAIGFDSEESLHNFSSGSSKAAEEHRMVKTRHGVDGLFLL